jgi:hypothetical protein
MDRFGGGRRPEESAHLGMALPVRLLGEGEVFPVGLGFAGECFFEILLGLAHEVSFSINGKNAGI